MLVLAKILLVKFGSDMVNFEQGISNSLCGVFYHGGLGLVVIYDVIKSRIWPPVLNLVFIMQRMNLNDQEVLNIFQRQEYY